MRRRSETIGPLGRAPARRGPASPPSAPFAPGPADRGGLRRWLRGALLDNLAIKALSMILAVTVFLLVNTDRDREITARVGVSYTLPDDRVLVSDRLDEVRITVKGRWQRLRRFDERELERLNLDLRRATSGDVPITPDMFSLPSGLTITSISPRSVRVLFDRRVEKLVEVTPQLAGRPMHGYSVAELKTSPATLRVRGPAGTLAALSALRTRDVTVEGRVESFTGDTEAVMPEGVEPAGTAQVAVQVTIEEELVVRKLPGLAVEPVGEGGERGRWTVEPAQVEVSLTGPLLAIEKAKAALVPVVRLSAGDAQPREAAVLVEGLPPGVGVKISPERVQVSPPRAAGPAHGSRP